jgi:hypothetical protein
MSTKQLAERKGDRRFAGQAVGVDVRQPAVFTGQVINRDAAQAILKMIGGGFEDSAAMEIVNPATGHFWHQDGISAPGGTDDVR